MGSPEMTTAGTGISPVGDTGRVDRSAVDDGRTAEAEDPFHDETDGTDSLEDEEIGRAINELENQEKSWFAYLKTKEFYIVLILGYAKYSMRPSACHIYDIY